MPTALEQLMAATGESFEELTLRHNGQLVNNPNKRVERTSEFVRILELPRRTWEATALAMNLVARMTAALKTPNGTMSLKPIQAAALYELWQFGGCFGPINVGGGKTLITFLAAAICNAQRPLLLVPANLVKKTERDYKRLRVHWKGAPYIRIMSYEMLGLAQSEKVLDTYRPDLIVADEVHMFRNKKAARTRRMIRYMRYVRANQVPTRFMGLSGTMTAKSIADYAHIARWCLPNSCFLPSEDHGPSELKSWADALDKDTGFSPGALFELVAEEDRGLITTSPLEAARLGYQRRMIETPGVIATRGGALGTSLYISDIQPPDDPAIESAFATMRRTWETPDGHPIASPLEMWQHCRELACGFFYRWNPRPPDEWLDARREWARTCREILKNNRSGLDSELPVVLAVDAGKYPHASEALKEWRDVKPIFEPKTECVWISDVAVRVALDWAKKHSGIIWSDHVFFCKELAKRGNLNYYGGGGFDSTGKYIEDHPPGVPMIASVDSNKMGRNLQFGWSRNLIVSTTFNNLTIEQLLGRTHREGQPEDTVTAEFYLGCIEHVEGLHKAIGQAHLTYQTTGQDQKLVYSDVDVIEVEEAETRHGAKWRKRPGNND